jgi:plastocyanin
MVAVAIGLVGCQTANIASNFVNPFGGGPAAVNIAVGDSAGSATPSFRPPVDTVPTADTVAWVVDAGAGDAPFNVIWDQGPTGATLPPNSGDLQAGQTYIAAIFTHPGWYLYHCSHHANMAGSLYVLPTLGGRIPLR